MACGLPVIACRTPGPAAIVTDGQALLPLPPKPLVVEPLDGVVERRQLVAATIRDVQRVINGLGPVSA
jgi:glycosyltransferase involved in cell wall biosynthesis